MKKTAFYNVRLNSSITDLMKAKTRLIKEGLDTQAEAIDKIAFELERLYNESKKENKN